MRMPITDPDRPTACSSSNYDKNHLAVVFGIRMADAEFAHTGCTGFGIERIAMVLLSYHGFQPRQWPQTVRQALWTNG